MHVPVPPATAFTDDELHAVDVKITEDFTRVGVTHDSSDRQLKRDVL